MSEILSEDATSEITKKLIAELKNNGKLTEKRIKSYLPNVLSEDVKSNLANNIIHDLQEMEPIMIEQITAHFPDFLNENTKKEIASKLVNYVQNTNEISVDSISEKLPDILASNSKEGIAKTIYNAIKKIRARKITASDVSRLNPTDISEDNIYNIGGLDGLVARWYPEQKEWQLGYDGESQLCQRLLRMKKAGRADVCTVVFTSAMFETKKYLFTAPIKENK